MIPRKWDLAGDLVVWLRAFANRTAAKIEGGSRVEHRPGSQTPGAPGGSFPAQIRDATFVQAKPWGGVLRWFALGHTFLFYAFGTRRQRGRLAPEDITPTRAETAKQVERSAARQQQEELDRWQRGRRR